MKRRSCSFKIFSNTFEKQFKMLMFYFISVTFLKIGLAEASFAECFSVLGYIFDMENLFGSQKMFECIPKLFLITPF